jgi:hypothetical protein
VACSLADRAGSLRAATLGRRLTGIAFYLRRARLDSPTYHPQVHAVLKGIKREYGAAQTFKRALLTPEIRRSGIKRHRRYKKKATPNYSIVADARGADGNTRQPLLLGPDSRSTLTVSRALADPIRILLNEFGLPLRSATTPVCDATDQAIGRHPRRRVVYTKVLSIPSSNCFPLLLPA